LSLTRSVEYQEYIASRRDGQS